MVSLNDCEAVENEGCESFAKILAAFGQTKKAYMLKLNIRIGLNVDLEILKQRKMRIIRFCSKMSETQKAADLQRII